MDGVGLRGSHFTMGGTSQKNHFASVNRMSFKQGTNQAPVTKAGDTHDLRGSHFELGNAQRKYDTTFKQHYQGSQLTETAALNEEKKNDLRTNHFVLGHQDGAMVSVTRAIYNEKPLQPGLQNEQDEQRNKMRAHNHHFAESQQKMMQSQYNQQYTKYPPQVGQRQNLQEKAVAIRSSNIILGKEKLPMMSIQQTDFAKKDGGAQTSVNQAFQVSHFALGNAKQDYRTMNQEYYKSTTAEANPFADENRQNLRATHFTLGQDYQALKSEQKANFRPYSQDPIKYQNNTALLQASHFNIGDPRFMNQKIQSSYQQAMKTPGNAEHGSTRNQQQDRGSNFHLGNASSAIDQQNAKKIYQSEFISNFGNPKGEAGKLSQDLLTDLRSSHFGFNDVKNNTFMTTNKATIVPTGGVSNTLDPATKLTLRSHHFTMGQTNPNYVSSNHEVHKPLNCEPSRLNEKVARDLRTHHFAFS